MTYHDPRAADLGPAYARTAEFDEASIPEALLNVHTTKEGAWGLIHVTEGRLRFRIDDPRRLISEIVLTPTTGPGLIEPTIRHSVRPMGRVRFHVAFHRLRSPL